MKPESQSSSSNKSSAELTQTVADFIAAVSQSTLTNANALQRFADAFITHAQHVLTLSQITASLLRQVLFISGFNAALLIWLVVQPLFVKPYQPDVRSYDANPIRQAEPPVERPYQLHHPVEIRNVT